ncbi:MAG: hypothetical protein AAGA54_24680 [Myxococcota bacterium]
MMGNRIATLLSLLAGLIAALASGEARAATYTNCFFADVRTTDSGDFSWRNNREDRWINCDTVGACDAKLRRTRVIIDRPGNESTLTLYTNEHTGCVTWNSIYGFPQSQPPYFNITVESVASNVRGKIDVLVHDDGDYTGTNPTTFSTTFYNANPNQTNFYVGNHGGTWTMFAALVYGIYQLPSASLPAGSKLYAATDTTNNCFSSAHYGGGSCGQFGDGLCNSNKNITSGRHYIRLAHNESGCIFAQTASKFLVAHEAGHAIAGLYYGDHPQASNGGEPEGDFTHGVAPDACGVFGSAYAMGSKEWNSIGFREGFAHFIAARMWNNKSSNGAFGWFGTSYDLEWDESGTSWGGRLENVCCTSGCGSSWDSAGTNSDWMRFFWDFYTNSNSSCPQQPDFNDMMALYRQVRLNGALTRSNYYMRTDAAAAQIGLPSCLSGTRFDKYGEINGVDNE